MLHLYREALTKGDEEQRTKAAQLYGKILELSADLDRKEVKTCGPLIRVTTSRHDSSVHIATLQTLK